MGIFDFFKKKEPKSQDVIQHMLATGAAAYELGKYSLAYETYNSILELEPNSDAMFNLGILYAQGQGVNQDYTQAATWFHKASLVGSKDAEKYVAKTMLDMVNMMLRDGKDCKSIFDSVLNFCAHIYEDSKEHEHTAESLYQIGQLFMSKEQYANAAPLFRAAAEFENHALAANWIGVLHNAGAGVEKNDLAALYWLDKGVDRGAEVSRTDRDGILNAYRSINTRDEFIEVMHELADYCKDGSTDIPKDPDKVSYWENMKYEE